MTGSRNDAVCFGNEIQNENVLIDERRRLIYDIVQRSGNRGVIDKKINGWKKVMRPKVDYDYYSVQGDLRPEK